MRMAKWHFQKREQSFLSVAILRGCAWLLLAWVGITAQAIQTDPNLSQLIHQQWQTEDGLPQNAVNCLAQDHEGFIWFGTENGLVRFDGVLFEVFTEESEPRVPHNFVSSLLVTRDGAVWAATRTGGLCRYRDGKFEIPAPQFITAKVHALAETSDGKIWAAAPQGLLRWDGTQVTVVPVTQNGLAKNPTALLAMEDGSLLVGSDSGEVFRLADGKLETVANERPWVDGSKIRALAYEKSSGTLWVAHDGAGLSRLEGNDLVRVNLLQEEEHLHALLFDDEGDLWIGSQTDGLIRLRNGDRVEAPASSDFSSSEVLSLLQDKERSIWVGTHFSGLGRLRKGKAVTLTAREGLTAPTVTCVVQEDAETLWVGTRGGGLLKYKNQKFEPQSLQNNAVKGRNDIRALLKSSVGDLWIGTYGGGLGRLKASGDLQFFTTEEGLTGNEVTALSEVDGNIWVGTVRWGISIFETATGRLRKIETPSFLLTHIRAFAQDGKGNLWIGTQHGLVRYAFGEFHLTPVREVPELSVRALLWEADDETLWVGTRDDGLLRIRGEQVVHFNAPKGLIHNRIYHLLATDDHLYLAGNQGIERISRSNLEEVGRGTADRLNTRLYGKREGLGTSEVGGDSTPSALVAGDGSLWFGTLEGLTYLPQSKAEHAGPPNVLIRSVTIDEKRVFPGEFRELLPGQARVEIAYTALSLRNPANVFFKYKLEGWDERWIDAGRRREAVYSKLKPGSYKFRVQACNDEGIWNEAGATLAFTVVPTIYQTAWFKALAGGTGILSLLGGYRWRVRQIRGRNKMLQSVVNERTKELRTLNEELESRVRARTAELRTAYENLQIELNERLEAERALARSEARLRRMVDSGMVGISFWERSGVITEANETFLRMVGYGREVLERGEITWHQLTPPEHRSLDAAALEEIRRTGVCTPFEKEYLRKDGTRIPILIGGASLGGDGDKGVCFVLDISKLKETEEEIRQLNLKLEARVHERTLELAHSNQQLAAEIQEREKVGVALAAFSHLGQKLHSARTENEAAKIVAETAKSLIPHDLCSIELYSADGKLSPILESVELPEPIGRTHCSISVPIRNGSRVVGVLGLNDSKRSTFDPADANTLQALGDYCGGALERIHAEEAKRETERRFSTFMTHAPALAWMKDSQFRYVFTNSMFQRFLGLEASQIEGKTDYDLWPDHVAFGMRTNDSQAVKSQAKLETQEQFRRHDGELRMLLTLRFLFTTAAGEQYVAGMAVDITEQKRAEEALHRLPQSIIEAQESERRRVARELHDGVNQAIASVKFRIQTAEQQILRADPRWQETCGKTKEMLDSVLQQVRRLSRNLRPGELDDFGLAAAARSACQEFELRNGIHVSFAHSEFAERLPPALELSLYRIIQEALTNVEKHSDATAVEINLTAEESSVILQISDNGCGFAPAQGARPDSGLGLLHMRERASLVGGVFSMTTAPGKGVQLLVQAPINRMEAIA
jgi:PAS domain S-box-containing protein